MIHFWHTRYIFFNRVYNYAIGKFKIRQKAIPGFIYPSFFNSRRIAGKIYNGKLRCKYGSMRVWKYGSEILNEMIYN